MKQLTNTTIHINTYHRTTKMKPADDTKFKFGDHVTISKYKNIFAKGYVTSCLKKFLFLRKLKILFPVHMLLVILKEKKFLERFAKKSLEKQIKRNLG